MHTHLYLCTIHTFQLTVSFSYLHLTCFIHLYCLCGPYGYVLLNLDFFGHSFLVFGGLWILLRISENYSLPKMTHVPHIDKILYIISWFLENILDSSVNEPLHLNDLRGPLVAWGWEILDNPLLLWGATHSVTVVCRQLPRWLW